MFLLIINIGMLVSSGFSVYLMTQSLESYNLDKINGPSKVISHASMYSSSSLERPHFLFLELCS